MNPKLTAYVHTLEVLLGMACCIWDGSKLPETPQIVTHVFGTGSYIQEQNWSIIPASLIVCLFRGNSVAFGYVRLNLSIANIWEGIYG